MFRQHQTFTRDELYEIGKRLRAAAESDEPPGYRTNWNLAQDANLEKGVMYMAGLNAREPACWVLLGLLAVKHYDKNLTIAAFEKAIQLGSLQAPILQAQIDDLRSHISKARSHRLENLIPALIALLSVIVVIFILGRGLLRLLWRRLKPRAQ